MFFILFFYVYTVCLKPARPLVPHFYLVGIVCVEICDNVAGIHRVDIQVVVVIVIVVHVIVYIQDQGENSGRKCGKVQSLSCRKRKLLKPKYSILKHWQSADEF
jgi:hypothetical protein